MTDSQCSKMVQDIATQLRRADTGTNTGDTARHADGGWDFAPLRPLRDTKMRFGDAIDNLNLATAVADLLCQHGTAFESNIAMPAAVEPMRVPLRPGAQPVQTVVERRIPAFDEPVGVEQQRGPVVDEGALVGALAQQWGLRVTTISAAELVTKITNPSPVLRTPRLSATMSAAIVPAPAP